MKVTKHGMVLQNSISEDDATNHDDASPRLIY